MLALLDGDIFAFRCAAASENDAFEIAVYRVNESIEQTLAAVGANTYQVWLSDKRENNFRRKIYPEYKANRDDQPSPKHLDALKQYLIDEWQANVAEGEEADDAMGIEQVRRDRVYYTMLLEGQEAGVDRPIICSIDKDLKQIPGRHYNFVKQEFDDVSPLEGLRFFYKQLLIGDRADNIFGVYGIGPKKANAALDHLMHEREMYETVRAMYDSEERLIMNGKVLWIRQQEKQEWSPPNVGTVVQD